MSDTDQVLLDRLAGGADPNGSITNLQLRVVDLDDSADVESLNIDGKLFTKNLPRLIVRYPRNFPHRRDLWSGRLSSEAVSQDKATSSTPTIASKLTSSTGSDAQLPG